MSDFSLLIRIWFRQNSRDLPWRDTKNPYFIWLSEIILQQTRVNQGLNYYIKFTHQYPTVEDLAKADEQEVLKLWQGLGYYSRARNLHYAAKQVVNQHNGIFPHNYDQIRALKGVGDYTAAAIASFAFELPNAVVDGNVYRVLARYFNDDTPIDTSQGKKVFQAYANALIDSKHPAEHNQAIMEIGALVCTPKQPKCETCPLSESCQSFRKNTYLDLPVKNNKTKIRKRYFHYLIPADNHYLIHQRTEKDVWQNLFQFPLIETDREIDTNELNQLITGQFESLLSTGEKLYFTKHILSHQHIHTSFWKIQPLKANIIQDGKFIRTEKFNDYPLPRVIDRFLETYDFHLSQKSD